MANEKKKRPAKRSIVRWDENLNELLLLSIQSVCNKEHVKIPWAQVAETMGNNITEGAVVQHLAKLRTLRVKMDKAVPPPLRRGWTGAIASSSKSTDASLGQGQEQAQKEKPKSQAKKRAHTDEECFQDKSDHEDSDWEPSRHSNSSKKKCKSSQKKSILTPLRNGLVDAEGKPKSDGEGQSSDSELVAVNAPFLKFLGSGEDDERASNVVNPEDEAKVEEKKSYIITLKPGKKALSMILHKGIGVYHERDPEKRWHLPASDPRTGTWGFSKDYYGPVLTDYSNSQNPGLLRGEWPQEVVIRQYSAPQQVAWADETHDPDPRIVHPAHWLNDEHCDPQLKFHRKLRPLEQNNSAARVLDQERPEYKEYVEKHRELPTYFDPSWNTAPTLGATKNSHAADFEVARPQLDGDESKPALIDEKWTSTIDQEVDDSHGEIPPGRIFDFEQIFNTDDAIDEAKDLVWWQD
ncbi:hypothetical protein BGW36DRAFT_335145 [Talaromyces proteolyticus]|uniref:Myb-like domain-containing protein n=1 Tax=Talaromyces proteolyticus TaxID=1131652 RepID=A0AAD4Q594_9EURO|nr:uncharacterized protein BGW36DRAFT_335145 [Talaromyces proteolyticus]KAH8704031.1 hypothetical protein BGW36DRAFT_335145 [Talaromyces proteolyticus]